MSARSSVDRVALVFVSSAHAFMTILMCSILTFFTNSSCPYAYVCACNMARSYVAKQQICMDDMELAID